MAYVPKNPHLSPNRIQKIAKDLVGEAKADRDLALQTHKFFRQMVDENPQDSTAKSLMVDCLKVAQASKNNVIKILSLVVKMNDAMDSGKTKANKGSENSVFSELDNLLND
jgi:hypothetical protein